LEVVRARRREPKPGWTQSNLADLKRLAADVKDEDARIDLRSEAAMALIGMDLVEQPKLDLGFPPYAIAYHPTEPLLVVSEWKKSGDGTTTRLKAIRRDTEAVVAEWTAPANAAWRAKNKKFDFCQLLRFSPHGTDLAADIRGGHILVWDWPLTGTAPLDIPVLDQGLCDFAFNTDGGLLFTLNVGRIYCVRLSSNPPSVQWSPSTNLSIVFSEFIDVAGDAADPLAAYAAAHRNAGPGCLLLGPHSRSCIKAVGESLKLQSAPEWNVIGLASGFCGSETIFGDETRIRWSRNGQLLWYANEHAEQARLWDMNSFRSALGAIAIDKGSGVPAMTADDR